MVLGLSAPRGALRDLCLQYLPHTGSSMSFWDIPFCSSIGSGGFELLRRLWDTPNWGLSLSLCLWTRGTGVWGAVCGTGLFPQTHQPCHCHSGSWLPRLLPAAGGAGTVPSSAIGSPDSQRVLTQLHAGDLWGRGGTNQGTGGVGVITAPLAEFSGPLGANLPKEELSMDALKV